MNDSSLAASHTAPSGNTVPSGHTCWSFALDIPLLLAMMGGKWVFVGALVLVLIWLIVMPRRLVMRAGQTPRLWRNVRVWAIVICVLQIWIYWRFG